MNRNLKVNESFLSRFIAIVTLLSSHVIFTVKAIEYESNKEANT